MENDFFEGMDELRKEYLINILEQVDKFINLFLKEKTYEEMKIRDFAHQIHGSGSSYGYDFITEAGKALSAKAKIKSPLEELESIFNTLKVKIIEEQKKLN